MNDLSGKVALITGSGAGLGQAIALRLAKEGADTVLVDIDVTSAEKVASEVEANGRHAFAIRADVSKSSDVKDAVDQTIKKFGRIDILVNNAGICPVASFLDTDEALWDKTLAINAKSQFLMAKFVVPQMIKQGGGKIINIGSEAGKDGFPLFIAYSASKHAVLGFTAAWQRSWASTRSTSTRYVPTPCPEPR